MGDILLSPLLLTVSLSENLEGIIKCARTELFLSLHSKFLVLVILNPSIKGLELKFQVDRIKHLVLQV